MKKMFSFLAVVILLVSFGTVSLAAENKFKATVTNGMDYSATKWYSSEESRAMFTVSVTLDAFSNIKELDSDDISSFLYNDTWVGISKSKTQLMLVGYLGPAMYFFIYSPLTGYVEYSKMTLSSGSLDSSTAALFAEGVLADQSSKYAKNSLSDILTVVASLFN